MALVTELAAGAVAGLAVAMPVGAVGTYLLGLGARSPWRTAAAGALGVASVDGGYAVLASVGGLGLRRWVEGSSRGLTVVAALVLVAVAVRTGWSAVRRFRRPVGARTAVPPTPGRAYALLVGMTAVNPSTLVTFSAVVLARSEAGSPSWPAAALFALGAFVASAAWQLLLAGGGSLLGRLLTGPRGRLAVGLTSGLVMLALAAALLLG
jgi:arginine exporter protein ArgO